jgi:hypothetical protein
VPGINRNQVVDYGGYYSLTFLWYGNIQWLHFTDHPQQFINLIVNGVFLCRERHALSGIWSGAAQAVSALVHIFGCKALFSKKGGKLWKTELRRLWAGQLFVGSHRQSF